MLNMRPLTLREKRIAWVALGLTTIYLAVSIIYKPLMAKEADLEQDIRAQLKILKNNFQILAQAKKISRQDQSGLEPFFQHRSDEEEASQLLSQLEILANQSALRTAEMKPQKSRDKESCRILSVSLSIEGSMLNIMRFLYAAQSAPYDFGIDGIFIESKVLQQNLVSCRLDLSRLLLPMAR